MQEVFKHEAGLNSQVLGGFWSEEEKPAAPTGSELGLGVTLERLSGDGKSGNQGSVAAETREGLRETMNLAR